MRLLFVTIAFSIGATVCFGQQPTDSVRKEPPTINPIVSPSNSVPMATPVPQTQPGKVLNPRRGKRKLRTVPPSDPNAFGVGVTIDKAKKDTLR